MSSLVERLRVRSDRKPVYKIDESDDEDDRGQEKTGNVTEKLEKIVRSDENVGFCQSCGEGGDLMSCETCTYSYHSACLLPPLKAPAPGKWSCPECVSPLNDVDKILDSEMRPTVAGDKDASTLGSKQIFVKQYLVKWKGLSYLHCVWVPEKEFHKAYKSNPRLRIKINNFNRQMELCNKAEDEFVPIRPEWTTVDRIIACRGTDSGIEYLVKWKELLYDECYWESEEDISAFQHEIERYSKFQLKSRKVDNKKNLSIEDYDRNSKRKHKEFKHYDKSPDFISGGSLHPYQLEGLNFLRFSWSKRTHVILADEMGLGKTIQSIAFLASLFKEGLSPHLVVAPLSTLRNWEREFATWAPQLNVVMYVGSAAARSVIREYEFYFPKKLKRLRKRRSDLTGESKQHRIKFDVLLTSYEMIILDTASLKPIKWESMIVDEGHRLKNKDSKLFISLKQYFSKHRVLLTGTPLQNNLDELFMLMHFLDAGKFGSLDEFQEEFRDINQEEQISRLHKILAPHLLRRVKKDVMKDLPPKKELILRVELSSNQKEYYKAILTRNYQLLTRRGGAQMSLSNVVMELRKVCCHPFLLDGIEPELLDTNEFYKLMLDYSGKSQLLDKMLVKLKEQGHRVLIYSQFQHMLDLLEEYCSYKKWHFERIDGHVNGADRQIRIDRFNAKDSTRFCFLLSTRAGGLGINLATADTVIIYDSDWNPHADLQAMARAHRLGQTNKVMIFRLITRGTIEERMMEMTKKKMVLEHLVVGKLKTQNINQEELDDILRYGSKELFCDENEEGGKERQIHYDDTAIDRLLDRDQVGVEENVLDDEEESGFLKAFKVANFEYVDDAEVAAQIEEQKQAMESKTDMSNSERAKFWEQLLKDKYEVHKIEEFNALGKGKRSRKQLVSVEGDDVGGVEDMNSNEEDYNYEAEGSDDDDDNSVGEATPAKKVPKKKPRVETPERLPLMEGEGKSFKVLGFNQNQRNAFVQLVLRFGVGEFDWVQFVPRLKHKTFVEVREYGMMFLSHVAEDITDSPTFSDGVPKEGLRVQDILVRIAILLLVSEKVKYCSENPSMPLFAEDITIRLPALRTGRLWKEEYDLLLFHALLRHGYGKWQAMLDDKGFKFQEIVSQELNLPSANAPVPGGSQAQSGKDLSCTEPGNNMGINGNENGVSVENGVNRAPANQDPSVLYQFREMQRKQVEFIKKRFLLLEKALNTEYHKECCAEVKTHENAGEGHECAAKPSEVSNPRPVEAVSNSIDQPPQIEIITSAELGSVASDNKAGRLNMVRLYNDMCKILSEGVENSGEMGNMKMRRNINQLEAVYDGVTRILLAAAKPPSVGEVRPKAPSMDAVKEPLAGADGRKKGSGEGKVQEEKVEANEVVLLDE